MNGTKVDVLGTNYTLTVCGEEEEPRLQDLDGFCDDSTKEIFVESYVDSKDDPRAKANLENQKRKVKRHEIIHAFLHESGLSENFTHPEYGHDETYVDWIASQFPKMCEVFKEVGCL